jgi:dTDP-4-amino-4,6-dideoxygalactose transaminase
VALAEAEAWAGEELSLPIFPGITEAEVESVCRALDGALAPTRARG